MEFSGLECPPGKERPPAGSESCVVVHKRVTVTAKRRQRVCRLRIGSRKDGYRESRHRFGCGRRNPSNRRARELQGSHRDVAAGHAHKGFSRNLGGPYISMGKNPARKGASVTCPLGFREATLRIPEERTEQCPIGTAERRKRSEAGRVCGSLSLIIVLSRPGNQTRWDPVEERMRSGERNRRRPR